MLDDSVGAALQEEGTLWPHCGFCEEINRELLEKLIGALLFGKCETSKQVKFRLYFDAFWRNCLSRLLFVLFFRYPGFTPLILLTLALDPVMRFIAGQMMSVTSTGTPPGEALNTAAFYLLALLFIASLIKKN